MCMAAYFIFYGGKHCAHDIGLAVATQQQKLAIPDF